MKIDIGIIPLYLIFINAIALLATVFDKNAAQRNRQRISENNLMFISVFGGSITMYLTMLIIRHKTHHRKFMIGLPVIIALQALIVFVIIRFF